MKMVALKTLVFVKKQLERAFMSKKARQILETLIY